MFVSSAFSLLAFTGALEIWVDAKSPVRVDKHFQLNHVQENKYLQCCFSIQEKLILGKLKFRLNDLTPYVFMVRFLKAAQSDKKLEHLAFFLIELCLVEYEALACKSSLLCASAIYVARCNPTMVSVASEACSL
ncbi:hypothetical protein K1719_016122 [Acacia pycnantha]|nr:hypothetical protein K1719_016122 [Acacia pycnantha]